MSSLNLDKFGVLRRKFHSSGIITLKNGNKIGANVVLAQREDGHLFFHADISRSSLNFKSSYDIISDYTGTLKDGKTVSLKGPIWVTEITGANGIVETLVGFPTGWEIGQKEVKTTGSVRFEILNFLFDGIEADTSKQYSSPFIPLTLLPLRLDGKDVELKQVSEYNKIKTVLETNKDIRVTCIATLKVESKSEIDQIIETIDILCSLLSVARGTLINWSAFEISCSDNAPYYSVYRVPIIRRFSGDPLIYYNHTNQTKLFIEKGFTRYLELDHDFELNKVINAYVEIRNRLFLETKCMIISVLSEYLANVQARIEDRLYFLSEDIFNEKLNEFKLKVEKAFRDTYEKALRETYEELSPDFHQRCIKSIGDKVNGFNRRPLIWKLTALVNKLKLDITKKQIRHFVDVRNRLAHDATFPGNMNPFDHYKKTCHFLDQIILGLFEYHGVYYDVDHNKITTMQYTAE